MAAAYYEWMNWAFSLTKKMKDYAIFNVNDACKNQADFRPIILAWMEKMTKPARMPTCSAWTKNAAPASLQQQV